MVPASLPTSAGHSLPLELLMGRRWKCELSPECVGSHPQSLSGRAIAGTWLVVSSAGSPSAWTFNR